MLTHTEIERMQAGREADKAIALTIMRWPEWDFAGDYDGPYPMFAVFDDSSLAVYEDEPSGDVTRYFSPSTDMNDAFEMEAEIERHGREAQLDYTDALMRVCGIGSFSLEGNLFKLAHASSLSRCKAALIAVGGKTDGN